MGHAIQDVAEHLHLQEDINVTITAKTILEHLGGQDFMAMTGAEGFIHIENGLCFRLPDEPDLVRDGINFIRIALNEWDLYDVEYHVIRNEKLILIHYDEDLYFDQLQGAFTRRTGLDTRMPQTIPR